MAAFANDRAKLNSLIQFAPPSSTSNPQREENDPKRLKLPEGPCNYRDLSAGPTRCGCRRFWCSAGLLQQQLGSAQGQEPWCVCGHHACFHDRKEHSRRGGQSTESSPESVVHSTPVRDATTRESNDRSQATTQDWLNHDFQPPERRATDINGNSGKMRITNTTVDTALVQPIPSFHLTSSELRGYNNYNGSIGLGLNFQRSLQASRMASQSPTVADAASLVGVGDMVRNDSWLPSTRQASADDNISPDGAFMKHIMEGRRLAPPIDVTTVQKAPAGLGLGDVVQSAPDVATPSVAATPDTRQVEQLMREATQIVDTIHCGMLTERRSQGSSAGLRGNEDRPDQNTRDTVQGALQRLAPLLTSLRSQILRNPDISIHESIQSLTRRMDALENASFNQLPPEQVHEQFQHMDMRLLDLENRADEHGRLISAFDLDNSSRGSRSTRKPGTNENASFVSNQSGRSLDSATSSALIAAAIDRVETESRLKAVEGRLDDLETMQMPSASLPWEIEVVLLPWGSELKGVWYTAQDLMKPGATQDDEDWTQAKSHRSASRTSVSLGESGWSDKAIHQWADNDEETLWPKACGTNGIVYHRLRSRGFVRKVTISAPGARDIANSVCKTFGEVLHTVSQGDNDSQMENGDNDEVPLGLTAPFIPLRKIHKSSRLRYLTAAELVTPTLWAADFLAAGVLMRAPGGQKRLFITTRAAYEQDDTYSGWTWPRLREMPRLHYPDSQQLSNRDVPEADAKEPCWKHNPAIDVSTSLNSSFHGQAAADAKSQETIHKSPSPKVDMYAHSPSDSDAEEEIEERNFRHPITPTSEFPSTQRSPIQHRRTRALSIPFSDPTIAQRKQDYSAQLLRPNSQQQKRRIRSFEQAPNPAMIAALPTFVHSPSRGPAQSMRIRKKRRVTKSKSASSSEASSGNSEEAEVESLHPEADPEQVLIHLQNVIPNGGMIKPLGQFEPRQGRDREQSPFFEVDASQSTSRMIQARAAEKRGITPSAYATPFSGTVTGFGAADDEEMVSDSGEDWAGVDEEQESPTDEDEDMDDEQEGSDFDVEANSDEGFYDEEQDDEMDSSSEDELQVS